MIYDITPGGNHKNPVAGGCETDAQCFGLAVDHMQHKQGFLIVENLCEAMLHILRRTGKTVNDLAVGDRFRFNMPTYSVLESLRVDVDTPTNGFAFHVEDSLGRPLTGIHRRTTYVTAAAGTVTQTSATVGTDTPAALGADTRDVWDFTREATLLDYEVPAGLEIVIDALPTTGAQALHKFAIQWAIGGRRNGVCHGAADRRRITTQTQTA